jgi:hypothetical protein
VSLESYATVGLNNEDNRKITSKYDKLKMRLKMIESKTSQHVTQIGYNINIEQMH